jgi:hypothetical protein
MLGASAPGLSEQLWAGLRADGARSEAFADDVRDAFDAHVETRAPMMRRKLAGWKKGSPLAARLSECRTVAKHAKDNPESAGAIWAMDTLKLAVKFVRDAVKASKPAKAPKSDGETVPAEIVIEADTTAGAAIIADLRAYLAAASEEDRLAVLVELEGIVLAG